RAARWPGAWARRSDRPAQPRCGSLQRTCERAALNVARTSTPPALRFSPEKNSSTGWLQVPSSSTSRFGPKRPGTENARRLVDRGAHCALLGRRSHERFFLEPSLVALAPHVSAPCRSSPKLERRPLSRVRLPNRRQQVVVEGAGEVEPRGEAPVTARR